MICIEELLFPDNATVRLHLHRTGHAGDEAQLQGFCGAAADVLVPAQQDSREARARAQGLPDLATLSASSSQALN